MTAKLPASMRAVHISRAGGPEVLQLISRPMPVPRQNEVLIKVKAAGVNGHDLGQRRRGSHPIEPGETDLPGLEASGEVVALGEGATTLSIGDQVCALMRGGGYAEYATATERVCLPVPNGLDLIQAAALPEACFTIWSNVYIDAALKPGETILINGGSGGIGVTAIQLTSALGHRVFATTRGLVKIARCQQLGAERVVHSQLEDYVKVMADVSSGKGVDVILELVAGDYIGKDLEALGEGGRVVIVGAAKGPRAEIDTSLMSRKRLRIMSSILRPRTMAYKSLVASQLLAKVWPLYEAGLRPVIDATFPLEEAASAHAHLESGAHFGKVVLIP